MCRSASEDKKDTNESPCYKLINLGLELKISKAP